MSNIENISKFYFNAQDNKVIRVTNECTIHYFQIIQYANGDIKHSSGKTTITDPQRMQKELIGFTPCDEQMFKTVGRDYYSKEKENAEKSRKYLLG